MVFLFALYSRKYGVLITNYILRIYGVFYLFFVNNQLNFNSFSPKKAMKHVANCPVIFLSFLLPNMTNFASAAVVKNIIILAK